MGRFRASWLSGAARCLALAGGLAFGGGGAAWGAGHTPQYSGDVHLGVASCSGSTCHGAVEAWEDSSVLQSEYVTWQRQDKHATAYNVLLNERSQRIARNLGVENAHTADLCLDCHADNVAEDKRGKQFQIADGVGCEACHGGAIRYLGIHISGVAGHPENVGAGMYPTDDPVERAELCISCHFGDTQKFVTHRIMGAGHPRMSFELDTFTEIMPAHFEIDADYRQRKTVANGVQTWAIGQAIAIRETLAAMVDPVRGRDGIFPELVLFDCQACHHPMSNIRWEPRAGTGLGPGIVRINDANLVMLRIIAGHMDEALGSSLRQHTLALHDASTQGHEATVAAAGELQAVLSGLVERLAGHEFGGDSMQALLVGVIAEGLSGEYVDYAAAEQATMALASILSAMRSAGVVDEGQYNAMNEALNGLFDAVAKDEEYRPPAYVEALRAFEATIPKS